MTGRKKGWDPDMRKEGIQMKQTTRKLLSLLTAFALVLTLAPTAWAEDTQTGGGSGVGDGGSTSVTEVTVAPSTATVKVGATVKLTATLKPEGATGTVSWSSSNSKIATVDTDGTVTGVATGTATITATCGDKSGTRSVTVEEGSTAKPVTDISLDKETATIKVNGSVTLKATVTPSDADNPTVTWESNETDVATVADGVVTGKAEGTATITAKAGDKTATCEVTVEAAASVTNPTGITLSTSNVKTLETGKDTTWTYTFTPSTVTNASVQWSSSDPTVADVSSNGKITAKKAGETTITVAWLDGATPSTTVKDSAMLTVTAPAPTASISPAKPTVTVGGTVEVTASISPSTTEYDSIDWTATDGTGKVSVTGTTGTKAVVFGASAGKATIKVTFKKGTDTVAEKEVDVTVTAAPQITLELPSTLTFGTTDSKTKTLTATVKGTLPENATKYNVKFEVVSQNPANTIFVNTTSTTLNTNQTASVSVTGQKNGTAKIKATLYQGSTAVAGVAPAECNVTVERTGYYLQTTSSYPGEGTSHKLSAQNTTTAPSSKTFSVTPYSYADGSTTLPSGVSVSYKWTLNSYTVQDNNSYWNYANQYTLSYDNQYLATSGRTLTCTATFSNASGIINTDSISWTVSTDTTSQIPVGVTVFDSNPGYGLDDTPDAGNTGSIVDQIDSRVRSLYGNSYSHYTVTFSSVGGSSSSYKGYLDASTSRTYYDSDLEDITFVPNTTISTSTGSETVSFGFTVNVYRYSGAASSAYDARYTGTMTFTIKQGDSTSGDIFYSAEKGEDVSFDLDDFEDFWTDYQKNGSLSHITIDSISGGKLYTSDGKAVTTGDTLYASPSRSSQRDLDGVYFTPSSRTTSTGKVTFTASGSRTGSGSSYTRKGTVSISFLSGAASAIAYSTNASGSVTLKAQDFIDAYKEATGSRNNPTNLTIQFQNVPSYGTLTYRSGSRDVKLTSSNVKSYKLTAKASGTSQVESVTYSVSGSRTETISYTGYIGNTATFTGEVTFNAVTAPTNVNVYLPTCYSAAGVALSSSYFTTANAAMSGASYVILGSPRTGRLTGSAGSALAPNAVVQLGSLNTVTYVPTASGTDSFTFTAYNSSNTQVASGTVTVVSVLTTVTTPGAITSITQLTDIPTNATANWYRDKLTYLINKGMINGKGNGKFGPEDQVEYSEALKFIMNAAGIVREESKVGNWAQNYLNTAVQNGWVSGSVDLTKPIPRTAMAELTARILGIPASTAASPFADTNNQWVTALYNATFTANGTTGRIIQGSNDLNGRLCFNPDKQLTRAEMVTLVYNMYMYKGN